MTFQDLQTALSRAMDDAVAAEDLLVKQDTPFNRRTYIRNTFSGIEGCIWLIKQACLGAEQNSGKQILSLGERVLLSETDYALNDKGEVKTQSKNIKLADNLRFTVNVANRYFKAEIDLEVGTIHWENFVNAIKVRNRITHPKKIEDTDISDEEIETCRLVTNWFLKVPLLFVRASLINAGLPVPPAYPVPGRKAAI